MGNTSIVGKANSWQGDHPHIHGEYSSLKSQLAMSGGSPPHTWGILNALWDIERQLRITPTYMGNTLLLLPNSNVISGSPPHTWGIPRYLDDRSGNNEDHPHIHGEYHVSGLSKQLARGSPPHTWGIRSHPWSAGPASWITPTYMGNTNFWVRFGENLEDHPHIHGEYER